MSAYRHLVWCSGVVCRPTCHLVTHQLHHHLRQLVAAGWLASTRRGHYEVPAARVVPLLVTVLAAHR